MNIKEQRLEEFDKEMKRLGGIYDFHTIPQDGVPNDCTSYFRELFKESMDKVEEEAYKRGQQSVISIIAPEVKKLKEIAFEKFINNS